MTGSHYEHLSNWLRSQKRFQRRDHKSNPRRYMIKNPSIKVKLWENNQVNIPEEMGFHPGDLIKISRCMLNLGSMVSQLSI